MQVLKENPSEVDIWTNKSFADGFLYYAVRMPVISILFLSVTMADEGTSWEYENVENAIRVTQGGTLKAQCPFLRSIQMIKSTTCHFIR